MYQGVPKPLWPHWNSLLKRADRTLIVVMGVVAWQSRSTWAAFG
jgi:hypothetical protein